MADEVQHVVMGNALQTSGDAIYGARHVGLKAGVPQSTPALTVNRLCGSGIQSVISCTQLILANWLLQIQCTKMEAVVIPCVTKLSWMIVSTLTI